MGKILVTLLVVCLLARTAKSKPTSDSSDSDELERSMRVKSLLHELDGLPDKELRDLLLQLKALRKLRMQTSTRNVADVPVGQLTEEELKRVSNSVTPSDHKKSHYIPLDIPHDLIRVSIPKTLEAFGVPRHGGGNKVLGEEPQEEGDEGKRQETSISVNDEGSDLIEELEGFAAILNTQ